MNECYEIIFSQDYEGDIINLKITDLIQLMNGYVNDMEKEIHKKMK